VNGYARRGSCGISRWSSSGCRTRSTRRTNSCWPPAGDPRQLPELDRTARPRVDGEPDLRGPSLWQGLRLPSTTHLTHMFHPGIDAWGAPVPEAARPDR
jgi:hypothetical protein